MSADHASVGSMLYFFHKNKTVIMASEIFINVSLANNTQH